MRIFLLHLCLAMGILLGSLSNLQAQAAKTYDNFQTVTDPDGVVYTYNMKGDPQAADPSKAVAQSVIRANPDFCKRVSPNWISYALLHQLAVDRDLRDSAQMIIDAAEYAFTREKPFTFLGELCRVANEITFGTGYYNFCPPYTAGERTNDLKFTGSGYPDTTFTYEIHLNTRRKRIFVVEKLNGRVLEINECYVGKVVFENDFDSFYENPVPNPPRDLTKVSDCQPFDPYADPTAVILANLTEGNPPLEVQFKGETSYDNDQDSQIIKTYLWDFGDGNTSDLTNPAHTFGTEGVYSVRLTVTDNEGAKNSTTQAIKVTKDSTPPPPPPPLPSTCDSCWMMFYRLESCKGQIDTLEKTPIRVICPAPPAPKVVMTTCCCNDSIMVLPPPPAEPSSRVQLAGGTVFKRFRGQLSEYSLGATGQIRFRFGKSYKKDAIQLDSRKWADSKWAGFIDLSVQPLRKATPLDDRPFRWSDLRDSIDVATGLPLVWHRGTERGTANLAIGAEFKPWRHIFIQGMGGVQRTFQQLEKSDPRKDPFNQFKGFDLEIFYGELRVGVRSNHLEIFFAYQLLQENEPFTRIPANTQGGTFTPRTDKSYNAGVQILF